MEFKNYEPIKFEIFQSDMEWYMKSLDDALNHLDCEYEDEYTLWKNLDTMKRELQHKIDCHKERGEWI